MLLQTVAETTAALAPHHSKFAFLNKWNLALLAFLKPLGIWGVCGLAIVDAGAIPMPLDPLVMDYVVNDHARAVLYCFMAALGSAIGSLVKYYVGRAGGELFLLKRINRQRYEALRDRFERQEFLAIMLPAMAPPPFPVTLFELAAGVFEMRVGWYFSAMFLGKFVRFTVVSFLVIFFGKRIVHTVTSAFHQHLGLVVAVVGLVLILLGVWVVRKLFDKRRGVSFPVEE